MGHCHRIVVPLSLSALLAGCLHTPTVPDVVRVPVRVPCITSVPVRPALAADAELAALDDYALVISLARDRRLRQGYEAELEAALEGCR